MITTIEELNQLIKTDLNSLDRLQPFVEDAKHILYDAIGYPQYRELELLAQESSPTKEGEEKKTAIGLAKAAFAAVLIRSASPFLDINITGVGYTTASQQNQVAASTDRVSRFNEGLANLTSARIDALLSFLELHLDSFPLWAQSRFCTVLGECFLASAASVAALTGKKCLRQDFVCKRSEVYRTENVLKRQYAPVFDTPSTKNDSSERKEAIRLFQQHVALLVFGKTDPGNELNAYVVNNASTLGYTPPSAYTNTSNSPIFFM